MFLLLEILLALFAIIALYQARQYALRQHPTLDYENHSTANAASWRWRQPEQGLDLRIEDTQHNSILHLPVTTHPLLQQLAMLGYLVLATAVVMVIMSVLKGDYFGTVLVLIVFGTLSVALLHMDTQVVCLELSPQHLQVVTRFGKFLYKKRRFKPSQHLHFHGAYESRFLMYGGQQVPRYQLRIKRRGFISSLDSCYYLGCNQSQGSWLVKGLTAWVDEAQ